MPLLKLISASPTAPSAKGPKSARPILGIMNDGSPAGIDPKSATPCSPKLNKDEAAIPSVTATSGAGIFGARCFRSRSKAKMPKPIANVR